MSRMIFVKELTRNTYESKETGESKRLKFNDDSIINLDAISCISPNTYYYDSNKLEVKSIATYKICFFNDNNNNSIYIDDKEYKRILEVIKNTQPEIKDKLGL